MSKWDDRIREHAVWTTLKSLGPVIDAGLAIDVEPEVTLGLERLKAILAYSGKRIAAADPQVTAPSALDAVASVLGLVQGEVNAFLLTKDPANIVNANLNADGALIAVTQVPGEYSEEELGALMASTVEYRKLVSEALSEARKKLHKFTSDSDESLKSLAAKAEENTAALSARADAIQVTLNGIAATIEAERQRMAAITAEQQGQFSAAQELRSKEYTENLRQANEGWNTVVREYQVQFSTAQAVRSQEHTSAETARQTKNNEMVAEFTKKLADQDAEFTKQRLAFIADSTVNLAKLVSEYGEKAALVLEAAQAKLKEVEKVAGVVGNVAVTSGYVIAANSARKAMWLWQFVTVAALIVLCGLAYATLGLLDDHGGRVSWEAFAGRALLLVSLGVLAAYSGTQADKLFTSERRNRKLALELEAIGPYLAPLPEEERNKFILQIGERSFGRDTDIHEHRKSPASLVDLLKSDQCKDVINAIVETSIKAVKPGK